ncbi:MAG: right-handed parallel beta-helix repeat-containing protein, partial [Candidatus Aenigmarchaeota archaeon]|nr:right-handed parallel beta-helix repeat-containing protein [Candidatus Aenigmarchaeota archaeon]
CQNNTIYCSGGGSYTSGIYMNNREEVVIKNCKIEGWTYGIFLEYSSENAIFNSIITSNKIGMFIFSSSDNKIYNNRFNNIDNINFSETSSDNDWNIKKRIGSRIYSQGTHIGGNYWTSSGGAGYSDNCADSDTDGFCDNQHSLGQNNIDYFPLSNKFTPDYISPNTTITGIKADGTNYTFGEWITPNNVKITLTCSDIRSGCNRTLYCLGNNTCEPNIIYLVPVQISGEGPNQIRYKSIDNEGNNETIKTRTINLLSTSQKIIINYPLSNTYLKDRALKINITILDNKTADYTNISIYNLTGGLVDSAISFENETFTAYLSVFEDGIYNIIASFYNIYGLKSEEVSNNIAIDTTPPNITSFEIGTEYKKGQEASAVCLAEDNLKGYFDGVVTGLDTSTIGEKIAICTATDDVGNYDTENRSYTVIEFVCESGEKRCFGNQIQGCDNNNWITTETCPYKCDTSMFRCLPKPWVCNDGEKRCYDDEVQICESDSWNTTETCKFGCNNSKCNSDPNQIDFSQIELPSTTLMAIVILVCIIGAILIFVYLKLFEKPGGNLKKEISNLEESVKKLRLQGKNMSNTEKEINLAKQDIKIGMFDMAKTRIISAEDHIKKAKRAGVTTPVTKPPAKDK